VTVAVPLPDGGPAGQDLPRKVSPPAPRRPPANHQPPGSDKGSGKHECADCLRCRGQLSGERPRWSRLPCCGPDRSAAQKSPSPHARLPQQSPTVDRPPPCCIRTMVTQENRRIASPLHLSAIESPCAVRSMPPFNGLIRHAPPRTRQIRT